jgi:predicted DNA-binding transcriptional regulator YafY
MSRSAQAEFAERVNAAHALVQEGYPTEKVVAAIVHRFQVSRRQAYRYLEVAQGMKRPIVVPEQKVVFTVKLPESVVARIRRVAHITGESLSALVAQALKAFLKRRGYGRKAS